MFEAVAIGDPHFDGHLCSIIPDYNKQIAKEIQSVIRWAENRGISNIILLGDIAHTPQLSYEAQQEFQKLLTSNSCQFYIILGNHDLISDDSQAGHSLTVINPWLKFIPHVHIYESVTDVEIDGCKIRFLPYPHCNFSKSRLNIAHIEVSGSLRDNGMKNTGSKLRSSDSVIISGHLHTPHKIRNTHYTGTLYQTKFGEKKKKGFHHIKFTSAKDYQIEWIPHTPKYTLHDVVIEGRQDLKRIPDGIHQLTRLIIRDGADVDPTDWMNRPNVVKTSPFKTKEELVTVLNEVTDGCQLQIQPSDYLRSWLIGQSYEKQQTKRILKLRKRLLSGDV